MFGNSAAALAATRRGRPRRPSLGLPAPYPASTGPAVPHLCRAAPLPPAPLPASTGRRHLPRLAPASAGPRRPLPSAGAYIPANKQADAPNPNLQDLQPEVSVIADPQPKKLVTKELEPGVACSVK